MNNTGYRGRFAPSPTGDLHLGSLVAALVSYCQARAHQGQWLLRIEDIDETRTVAGADQLIIDTLARLGMQSDEPVMFQTDPDRQAAYQAALSQLDEQQLTFPCGCSRKDLSGHPVYPGTCRQHPAAVEQPHSIRLKVPDVSIEFEDLWQGPQRQDLAQSCGDFNIKRKDGLFCYQLAVVLDDADQGITEVVRGIDIMDSTPRQIYLQQLLHLPQPGYAHFPVITHQDMKLSKQNHARPITHEDPYRVMHLALQLLGQNPPAMKRHSAAALLAWATEHWQPQAFAGLESIAY